MPVWKWVARFNKRVLNNKEIRKGKRPVLTHVGRTSGTTFRTPMDAHRVEDTFVFILMYGSGSDWVKNVLAAETARLKVGDDEFDLGSPRLRAADEAWGILSDVKKPPGFLKVSEFLQMDIT